MYSFVQSEPWAHDSLEIKLSGKKGFSAIEWAHSRNKFKHVIIGLCSAFLLLHFAHFSFLFLIFPLLCQEIIVLSPYILGSFIVTLCSGYYL